MSAARETIRSSGGPKGVVAVRLRKADGAEAGNAKAAMEAFA
jgi:hypothetical protein